MAKAYKNDCLMFFGDTHFPYHHPKVFEFLARVKSEYNPERVFHTGDLTDQYVFSSYSKLPESESIPEELKNTRKAVAKLGVIFPDLTILESNHDDRVYKRARLYGIPKELLLPYSRLIAAEKFNWKWVPDYTLRLPNKTHLYVCHTKSGTALNMSRHLGMNVVVGHHHSSFGVNYTASPLGPRFGVDCGCLISDNHYAFAYNKQSLIRPLLGCVVIKENHPILIPFK